MEDYRQSFARAISRTTKNNTRETLATNTSTGIKATEKMIFKHNQKAKKAIGNYSE